MRKTGQSGGYLRRLSEPLLKTRFSLIGNLFKALAKDVLKPPGSTASVTDSAIYKSVRIWCDDFNNNE